MALTPTETRALLARLGHVPKRFLGQNFLVDGNIVRKSLELARISAGDTAVEVGPGLGTLTGALLEAGAEVWAIERDKALFAHLAADLAPRFPKTLHLAEGDAVETPLAGLSAERAPGCKVVANLPYAISSPWMDAVLSGSLPSRMVLMLQREAADRYTASPGTRNFGAISIFLQAAYDTAPGHRVRRLRTRPRWRPRSRRTACRAWSRPRRSVPWRAPRSWVRSPSARATSMTEPTVPGPEIGRAHV